ncbi:MAG: hypothetical protein IPF83_08260 [Rhodanobacteraceae bacterium]|nr:hypothetical protein [Rhodanobacteraceae bacterium]MBK7042692.1 hypothetical protein [Rhodanobacteraceae bacterium]MBP9155255.1 hypothetical protein [Xanthomonadales bacterium]HQW81965.1 hypothetical protein [Pseudomonadota bacterium]
MTTSLLDLALSLLLTTAASIGHAAPAAQFGQAEVMDTRPPIRVEAAVTRRQARAARISLMDPYYSFSRAKRVTAKG